MISLSATTYDPSGCLVLKTRARNAHQGARRGSVTATLDGGAYVYDGGYSVADQTLTATLRRPSREQLVALQYLVAYYGTIVLCCETGAFSALLSFQSSGDLTTLTLRLLARLDV